MRRYTAANTDAKKARDKDYQIKNRERIAQRRRAYWQRTRQEQLAKKRAYYLRNKEEVLAKCRAYNARLREQDEAAFKALAAERERERRKRDPRHQLHGRVSALVRQSIKQNKGGRSWEKLVGYSLDRLCRHLRKTMPSGYSWEDYLDGRLQIDHIIPVSAHRFQKPEDTDFKRCWNLRNLRLLPAAENNRKNGRVDKPFQPTMF